MNPFTSTENKVIEFVAFTIIEHLIIKEGYNRICKFFFPKEIYETRLINIIYKTIKEFEDKYPNNPDYMRFYQSEAILTKLLDHLYFKTEYKDINEEFEKQVNIEIPPLDQLNEFFNLFKSNVNKDTKLKKLYYEGNFQSEIFNISSSLSKIHRIITNVDNKVNYLYEDKIDENRIYEPERLIDSLNKQVYRQLKKQLNSGKYLPYTFIEIDSPKDHLRYLCNPFLYADKVFNEINVYDFWSLNESLRQENKAIFDFGWEKQETKPNTINHSNNNKYITDWIKFLQEKIDVLNTYIEPGRLGYDYVFRENIEDLDFLKSPIALITETAGQGKTNLLCDFVETFLVKLNIPSLFLTGSELNANNIRKSILNRLFPDTNIVSFDKLLESIKNLCHSSGKFFIIVIDGINENTNPRTLSKNIELFIEEILEYHFIKVIITCRTEYFNSNFQNLTKSSFKDKIQKITSLTVNRMDDRLRLKLFRTYFLYFKVSYDRITKNVYEQLVGNFLLLRIFCEAYQNSNIGLIDTIYKQELFNKYYEVKCEEINKRLNDNDEFNITGNINIRDFIETIIDYMIRYHQYFNIPFDNLIKEPKHKAIYIRFLDENILVKRDLDTQNDNIFTQTEVVNFTFDEFRDFLISKYLIEKIFPKSIKQFEEFVQYEINEKSSITEGCSTYLFFISRKNKNSELLTIINSQPWYNDVFAKCILAVRDEEITVNDRILLQKCLIEDSSFKARIIGTLVFRRDVLIYKQLNIDFLLETIRSYEEEEFKKIFIGTFEYEHRDYRLSYGKINIKDVFDYLENLLLDDNPKFTQSDDKLFEFLIYMFSCTWRYKARYLFERYSYLNRIKSIQQLNTALKSKNKSLITQIQIFVKGNEINL